MRAVYLKDGGVEMRNVPQPERAEGFALVRVLMSGICNTDLELRRGYYGFEGTPGHEFAGEVVEADNRALIGRRVVGEINLACGSCEWCRAGRDRHCPVRTVLGIVRHPGAFAEFLTLPERNLRVLPDEICNEAAVFVEPLAAACRIPEQVAIPAGSRVAVLGDGKLGLLIGQVLAARGMKVHQFGRHRDKLQIVERRGVHTEIAGRALPEKEFEWVVDATGSAEGLNAAVRTAKPLGTVILKSTVHGEVPVNTAPAIVDEITLIGSRCGRFEPAIQMLKDGLVDVSAMISGVMPFDKAPEAFDRAEEKGTLKLLLTHT